MREWRVAAVAAGVLALVGCGGDDDDDGEAGGGTGGSAANGGSSGMGGSGAGISTGGSSGAEESGHCSPALGTYWGPDAYAMGPLANCSDYDPAVVGGGIDPAGGSVRDIALAAPIGPQDTYAFSADLETTLTGWMELWGATEQCGAGLELLATSDMGDAIRCMEARPAEGTYSHLLWVWHGAGSHYDVTVCPDGYCGL